jgi:malonyl-CoA decarboxylase
MRETLAAALLTRSLQGLRDLWPDWVPPGWLAGLGTTRTIRPDLPEADVPLLRKHMGDCLEGRGGEVSARVRAAELGRAYVRLTPPGRARFLRLLAGDFQVDRQAVEQAIESYRQADPGAEDQALDRLRALLTAPRERLLTQFNELPDGTKFLVDLRADLLRWEKNSQTLAGLDRDLVRLLTSWFDVGFLRLERITWESPASLLAKLIAYEAVHEIESWDDLRNRLETDRRCYAFFHPRMPGEPLIFIEVALVNGLAGSIQTLLDQSVPALDPGRADTAVFYSISNTQPGLRGISFGGFLIKQVVDALSRDLPRLKAFATLSPIPGFRSWLEGTLAQGADGLLQPREAAALAPAVGAAGTRALSALLARPDWHRQPELARAARAPLTRLCARYLLQEKQGQQPFDPVARFHLGNGARIEQLNWLGDTSAKGIANSCGFMVNYGYRLGQIERNHEAYAARGRIAAATHLRKLLRP